MRRSHSSWWRSGRFGRRAGHAQRLNQTLLGAATSRNNQRACATASVAVVLVIVIATHAVRVSHAAAADSQVWYWTPQLTAASLYENGIDWSSARRHDALKGDTCWGLGYAQGDNAGSRHFRYFWCEAIPV